MMTQKIAEELVSNNSLKTLISSDVYVYLCKVTDSLVFRLLEHPLLDLISNLGSAKFVVGQYLHFAAEIPRITGLRYGLCKDETIRRSLLSVMIEEDGYYPEAEFPCQSHYSLAKVTAKSLGVEAEPEIHVGTATLLSALEMEYKSSLISSLASSYAREGIYPKLMPKITEQLFKACPSVNTIFFDVHAVGDVAHSEAALKCIICTLARSKR